MSRTLPLGCKIRDTRSSRVGELVGHYSGYVRLWDKAARQHWNCPRKFVAVLSPSFMERVGAGGRKSR